MQQGRNLDLTLSLADAEAIADPLNVPDMAQVAPEIMGSADVSLWQVHAFAERIGVTPAYEEVRNFPVDYGSFITELDLNGGARVAGPGSKVAERLYGADGYAIGTNDQDQGACRSRSSAYSSPRAVPGGPGGHQDETVLVPLSTAHQTALSSLPQTVAASLSLQ